MLQQMPGPVATLIEWDEQVPEMGILLEQARCAQSLMAGHGGLYMGHNAVGCA